MIAVQSQRTACPHLGRTAESSPHGEALPSGIPDAIWTSEVAHTGGDHGIPLELIPLDVYGQ